MAYGDDTGFNNWLASLGYSLPVGAPDVAVLRQRGSVYIDGLGADQLTGFIGGPTDPLNQTEAWPRAGAVIGSTAIPTDTVPNAIVTASYMAAYQEASKPGSLSASGSMAGAVKRKRVEGAVEIEYQAGSATSPAEYAASLSPVFSQISALLRPFMRIDTPRIGITSLGGGC